MKDTDDDKLVDGSDAGAVPATSTIRGEYQGIVEFSKAQHEYWKDRLSEEIGTRGQEYYYTPDEWSRSIGWGKVPDDRNTLYKIELEKLEKEIQYYPKHVKPMTKQWDRIQELRKIMGVNQHRRTDETLSEESDTKT